MTPPDGESAEDDRDEVSGQVRRRPEGCWEQRMCTQFTAAFEQRKEAVFLKGQVPCEVEREAVCQEKP